MSHTHPPTHTIPTFADAIKFHGHTCPGLALGYRAALVALEELRSDPSHDEELVAIVENDACGIDALQVVTGCTAGKGNLIFRDYGKHVYTLINRKTGKAVRVATLPTFSTATIDPAFGELRAKAMSGKAKPDEIREFEEHRDKIIHAILTIPYSDIFSVRRVEVTIPEPAKIFGSIPCDRCGELVAEHRIVEKGGKKLCIPCAEEEN